MLIEIYQTPFVLEEAARAAMISIHCSVPPPFLAEDEPVYSLARRGIPSKAVPFSVYLKACFNAPDWEPKQEAKPLPLAMYLLLPLVALLYWIASFNRPVDEPTPY